ncbi:MAG TPA: histidine phosphatase family protein [Gaiellaceae bacterium]|nr:histidine phosphatase family protein [Gaiellaceae bacterium]
MRLYLVRHAEAAPGHPDELRPITPRGRDQARAVGRSLREARPALVLTSPLLRARETGAAIAKETGAELRVDERLAPGADVDSLVEAVAGCPEPVVAVGHQPDCGEIATALGVEVEGFAPADWVEIDLP